MNEMVAILIDEMSINVKTNTFVTEWLKGQALRVAKTLAKASKLGGAEGRISRRALESGIAQKPGPWEGLPDSCEALSGSAQNLQESIAGNVKMISGSGIVRMWETIESLGLDKDERPDRWKMALDEMCAQTGAVMAACDLSEDDDINSLPYPVYIRYDEVRDAEYLCRVMAAMLGAKMQ